MINIIKETEEEIDKEKSNIKEKLDDNKEFIKQKTIKNIKNRTKKKNKKSSLPTIGGSSCSWKGRCGGVIN